MRNRCPQDNTPQWQSDKPKQGEPEEKKVDNVTHQFCNRYKPGEGLWTTGRNTHKTSEHKTPAELRTGGSSGGSQVAAGMAMIHEELDPDTPLEV